jgi:hypothetical protein
LANNLSMISLETTELWIPTTSTNQKLSVISKQHYCL